MDCDAFDRLTTALATSPSRRRALGALLGAGVAGVFGVAEAKQRRKSGKSSVSAQALCASPGPSTNLSGCNFTNADFSGDDLSGTRLVGTIFRNAALQGTNLSSSNAKNADFRQANLTCANLRSSMLGGASFNGANLTRANLKSSGGCNAASFTNATTFCATTMCDGSVRNDDCAGGQPMTCCGASDCPPGQDCQNGECRCPAERIMLDNGTCAIFCLQSGCPDGCGCDFAFGAVSVCTHGHDLGSCAPNADCPVGQACTVVSANPVTGVCRAVC